MDNTIANAMNKNLNILALDPASRITGWAAMASATEVIEGGLIASGNTALAPWERCYAMRHDLRKLLTEFRPRRVIVEWPSVHVAARRHAGGGAGLAIYGAAVGELTAEAEFHCEMDPTCAVVCVDAETWTNRVPKKTRQSAIEALYDCYDRKTDPGGDLADAIALGRWWFTERAQNSVGPNTTARTPAGVGDAKRRGNAANSKRRAETSDQAGRQRRPEKDFGLC